MKTLKLFTLLLAVGIITSSCKKDPESEPETAQQKFAKALEGTWSVPENGTIEKDDENVTGIYPNFEIVITANTTTATAITGTIAASGDELEDVGNIIGSGTWSFSGTGVTSISLAGGAEISSITFSNPTPADAPSSITVNFSRTESAGSIKGLVGEYSIQLTKE